MRTTLIRALEQEEIVGKLWTVQRGRVREYRPDLPDEIEIAVAKNVLGRILTRS